MPSAGLGRVFWLDASSILIGTRVLSVSNAITNVCHCYLADTMNGDHSGFRNALLRPVIRIKTSLLTLFEAFYISVTLHSVNKTLL